MKRTHDQDHECFAAAMRIHKLMKTQNYMFIHLPFTTVQLPVKQRQFKCSKPVPSGFVLCANFSNLIYGEHEQCFIL